MILAQYMYYKSKTILVLLKVVYQVFIHFFYFLIGNRMLFLVML